MPSAARGAAKEMRRPELFYVYLRDEAGGLSLASSRISFAIALSRAAVYGTVHFVMRFEAAAATAFTARKTAFQGIALGRRIPGVAHLIGHSTRAVLHWLRGRAPVGRVFGFRI